MDTTTLVKRSLPIARPVDDSRRVRADLGGIDTAAYVASLIAELDRVAGYIDDKSEAPEPREAPPATASDHESSALVAFMQYQVARARTGR